VSENAKLNEVSEIIRDHLTKQNARAHADDDCLYKAPNGNMCAVGCLIKPEHYSEDFEHQGIDSYPIQEAVEKSVGLQFNPSRGNDDPAYVLLSSWQAYHDEEYQFYIEGTEYFGNPARSPGKIHELLNDPATIDEVRP
jgi:hypothetical protein